MKRFVTFSRYGDGELEDSITELVSLIRLSHDNILRIRASRGEGAGDSHSATACQSCQSCQLIVTFCWRYL